MRRNIEIILKNIETVFQSPPSFYDFVPCENDVLKRFSVEAEPARIRTDQSRVKVLKDCFRQIPASPKNAGAYRKFYVKATGVRKEQACDPFTLFHPATERRIPLVVNSKHTNDNDLADQLADRAKGVSLSRAKPVECLFILGQRGCGKTAWLNHLFSTQHGVFDRERVVWVRVDLAGERALRGATLLELLNAQVFDILVDHYLDGGEPPILDSFFDAKDYETAREAYDKRKSDLSFFEFRKWLSTQPQEYIESFAVSCDGSINIDEKEGLQRIVDLSNKAKAGRMLRNFVRSKGYSFIYVLDGLDEAHIPLINEKRLNGWFSELRELLAGKRFPRGLYLICMRVNSALSFAEDTLAAANCDASSMPSLRMLRVNSVHCEDILKGRMRFIKAMINMESGDWRFSLWDEKTIDLIYHLTLYLIEQAFVPLGSTLGHVLEALVDPGHIRGFLSFFRDALWETVAVLDEFCGEKKVVRWYEAMAANPTRQNPFFGGWKEAIAKKSYRIWALPSLFYTTAVDKTLASLEVSPSASSSEVIGTLAAGKGVLSQTELPLVPVAWWDTTCQRHIADNERTKYLHNHLLLKVHIFQYVLSCGSSGARVERVKKHLEQFLSYDPVDVEHGVKVMLLQGLVDIAADVNIFTGIKGARVRATRLGKLIMGHWLTNPSYIEATIHCAAVPETLESLFPVFKVRRRMGPTEATLGLPVPEYLEKSLTSLVNFAGLVTSLEEWVWGRYLLAKATAQIRKDDSLPNWEPILLSERISKSIASMLERMIKAASKSKRDGGTDRIVKAFESVFINPATKY